MLDEELGEKTPVEPVRLLKCVDGRVFRLKSQIEGGVSKWEGELDHAKAVEVLDNPGRVEDILLATTGPVLEAEA